MHVVRLHAASLVLSSLLVGCEVSDGPGDVGGDLAEVRREETIVLVGGPEVRVTYDPEVWKPWKPPKPGEKPFSMSWRPVDDEAAVVRVHSSDAELDEKGFAEQVAFAQQSKNDPGVFVRSRKEKLDGRDWLVLEYRYPTRRPTRYESAYFTATKQGHVQLSVFADEAKLAARSKAIAGFLRGVRVE